MTFTSISLGKVLCLRIKDSSVSRS